MNSVTMVGGAALFLAPLLSGYTGTPAMLWTNLMMGMALVATWVPGFSLIAYQ